LQIQDLKRKLTANGLTSKNVAGLDVGIIKLSTNEKALSVSFTADLEGKSGDVYGKNTQTLLAINQALETQD
jgi:hypothetical protein